MGGKDVLVRRQAAIDQIAGVLCGVYREKSSTQPHGTGLMHQITDFPGKEQAFDRVAAILKNMAFSPEVTHTPDTIDASFPFLVRDVLPEFPMSSMESLRTEGVCLGGLALLIDRDIFISLMDAGVGVKSDTRLTTLCDGGELTTLSPFIAAAALGVDGDVARLLRAAGRLATDFSGRVPLWFGLDPLAQFLTSPTHLENEQKIVDFLLKDLGVDFNLNAGGGDINYLTLADTFGRPWVRPMSDRLYLERIAGDNFSNATSRFI